MSIKSLLETRFSKLSLVQLCEMAQRALLIKEDLTSVDGIIYRPTVINILKRRYIFGIITALLKSLNSNVFEYIAKFVDFDIKWQERISEYLSSVCFTYKTEHSHAIFLRNTSQAPFNVAEAIHVRYTGRKSHIINWISKCPNHQLAYYKFKKQQNIAYNEQKKNQKSIIDLNAIYEQTDNDWIHIYAFIHFPKRTKKLFTQP
jgi:hypothetical protein